MSSPWARLTRRKFAALAAAVPAAAQAGKKNRPGGDRSGAESTQGAATPAASAATADASLQKAYASVQKHSERLAQIDLAMDVEPAFVFRAAR